ncbi:MAG: putative cation transport regulator ChaB [Chlamydiia bacterium]|nr:putative cation transport regulator ChaB [Chlamydiia bacterium]
MPYASNSKLPATVRDHLPRHAQDIFREAFNSAYASKKDASKSRQEEYAFRVAWSAVKKVYEKGASGDWVKK